MSPKNKKSLPAFQPKLFPDLSSAPDFDEEQRRRAGESMVRKLLKVRRELSEAEKVYLTQINTAIEDIRSFCRYSPSQLEEIVLYAIEKQKARTKTDIIDDTRMDKETVFDILRSLLKRKIIREVSRYVVGSDRPQYMYKSNRIDEPEAD